MIVVRLIVASVFLVAAGYLFLAYEAYRDASAPERTPAAQKLVSRQVDPETPSERRELAALSIAPNIENYRLHFTSLYGVAPEITLCVTSCDRTAPTFALAYGLHYDRSWGADNWDFWFAPVSDHRRWLGSPLRLLYRVNPGQSDSWGITSRPWTDQNVLFSENAIAGVWELDETALAAELHHITTTKDIAWTDRVGAGADGLTIHSGFLNGPSSIQVPGWRPIGEFTERSLDGAAHFADEVERTTTPGGRLALGLAFASLIVELLSLLRRKVH